MTDKEKLVEEYKSIIDFCEKYKAHGLGEYQKKLQDKLDDLNSPLKIMIVGEGKSGKSTVLNAVTGVDIAPVGVEPKTWCINLYAHFDGKPYAEIVYHDGVIERASIEEAKALSERLSDPKYYDSLSEREKSIDELRWYTHLDWPGQGIFIVDTPGFDQVRSNTAAANVELDAVEGVKFSSNENFDKYYYKSDLVLWCFDHNAMNAVEVENHLKAVYKQGKTIYGIVTKLDRIEDPDKRESIFKKNENKYMRYKLAASIRSGLPTVYEDDDEEEKEAKKKIREDSVDSIRRSINYLLNGEEAENIKIESSKRYLEEVKNKIATIESELMAFYFENMSAGRETLDNIKKEIGSLRDNLQKEYVSKAEDYSAMMKSEQMLYSLWMNSKEDVEVFANSISYNNVGFEKNLSNDQDVFTENINSVIQHNMDNFKLKSITVSLDNPVDAAVLSEEQPVVVGKNIRYFVNSRVYINPAEMGFVYQFMQLFNKTGLIYQAMNIIMRDTIRENALRIACESIDLNTDAIIKGYKDSIGFESDDAISEIEAAVNDKMKSHTGYTVYELPETIVDLEDTLVCLGLYSDEEFTYYPQIKNGRFCFVPSHYRKLLNMEPENIGKEASELFGKAFIDDRFEERMTLSKKNLNKELNKYNGASRVEVPKIEGNNYDLFSDEEILELIPPISKINWLGIRDDVYSYYEKKKKYTIDTFQKYKSSEIKNRKKNLIVQRYAQLTDEVQGQFERFKDSWKSQLSSDINIYLTQKNWMSLPPSADYVEYYYSVYSRYNYADKFSRYLCDFIRKKTIPKEYVKRYMLLDPYGDSIEEEIEAMISKRFIEYDNTLKKEAAECLSVWGHYFQNYYTSIQDVCDQYFSALDDYLSENVKLKWDRYKKSNDISALSSCKNILEYAKKSGILPKNYTRFLAGDVPELNQFAGIICADGSRMKDYWKKYINDKLDHYMKEWR